MKSAEINVSEPGTYTVIFADYEGSALENADAVTVTAKESDLGKITVHMEKDFKLGVGDKIMLWVNLSDVSPMCKALTVE